MTKSQLLPAVLTNTSTLKLILNEEFDALKVQDLSAFEALQSRKADILALLTDEEVIAQLGNYSRPSSKSDSQSDGWNRVISVLETAKSYTLETDINRS
jgi:FlgN protein.